MKKLFLYILILSFVFLPQTAYAVGAFPGCEGYGCKTRHAYTTDASPDIYIVNTLDCDAAAVEDAGRCPADAAFTCGTDYKIYESGLETAMEASGAKIIIFDVGGEMKCDSIVIQATDDEVFVAGQTSPTPGVFITELDAIKIMDYPTSAVVQDIVLQHIRVLAGDTEGSKCENSCTSCDGITMYYGTDDIVIDHYSGFFTQDENIGIDGYLYGASNITISNSILSFPLPHSNTPCDKAVNGFGPYTWNGATNISHIRNLISTHYYRNPQYAKNVTGILVNNLIYNWGGAINQAVSINLASGSDIDLSFEGNYFDRGPDTNEISTVVGVESGTSAEIDIYCANNYLADDPITWTTCSAPSNMYYLFGGTSVTVSGSRIPTYPTGVEEITVLTPANARTQILANAGAYPAYRASSSWDTHAIADATDGTIGGIQASVANYGTSYSIGSGGWGTMTSSGSDGRLILPVNPHSDGDSDGYTNLEEWIHSFTAIVEGTSLEAQNVSPIDGGAGYSITASATWYYSAYVDDVELWLDTGACDGTPLDGDLDCINTDDCVGDESSADADFTYDMSTLDENTTYCLTLQTNYGAEQGDWQQFEFTTTTGPPAPPAGLAIGIYSSSGMTGVYDDQGATVGE